MKYSAFLICFLFLCCAKVQAQQTFAITGSVKDEDHLALPGATVFLTGTRSITACDLQGVFHLDNLTPGTYELVVKMVGYYPFIKTVTLTNAPITLAIQLKPDKIVLKDVKIHPDYDRAKHLELFKKQFLGQSYNVKYCKILNPDVLYFNYDKKEKKLSATANDFLVIQNMALGYKLKYLLTNFDFDENTNIVTFQGYPSFEEMTGTTQQQVLWAKNRKIAYAGSINHFVKSIYTNRVLEEGFVVFKLLNRPIPGTKPITDKKPILVNRIISFDSLLTVVNKDSKSLTFKDCLYVVYKNETEPENFKELSYTVKQPEADIPDGQASLVYLLAPSVNIDYNGLYDPTGGLFFEGYFAWEKAAELLPSDYRF